MDLQKLGKNAVKAKYILQSLSTVEKNRALMLTAAALKENAEYILTENEILVGNALINLLENWDFILTEDGSNKLNKSMVLYYLREATRLSTKEIRASMKKYKKAYYIKKEEIIKENNF